MLCLVWLWPRNMRYVERIPVVACGLMFVVVIALGRVMCIGLSLLPRLCASIVCVFGFRRW